MYNGEYFCRYIGYKILISKEKKIIENKSFIFFTDFDIKRLIASEHLLIDGTFVYPMHYMQTIIIMYYDVIIEKMIPWIFIIINNKTQEGYKDSFTYIKEYINKSNKQSRNKLKFKTFTTDFEIALFKAFNEVFNEENEIKHIGCYFHYLQNIRKYLQKNGLTAKKNIAYYNSIINICKSLPFMKLKLSKISSYIKEKANIPKNILDDFILYFEEQWLSYFKDGSLQLDEINIKFRTNNSLENFNRRLKSNFHSRKNINIINFIDILVDEVQNHEAYLIEENRKPLAAISINKLKGKSLEKDESKNIYYESISKEILEYDNSI